jgi:hypothetical protein
VGGYCYVPGYWDYAWESRGILYAPCRFHHLAIGRPGFIYRPRVVIDLTGAFFHLWVRPRWGCYYFGDYYDHHYVGIGFHPWYRYHHHRRRAYDPLFVHSRWRYGRDHVNLYQSLHRRHGYYRDHRDHRPARTYRDVVDGRRSRATGAVPLARPVTQRSRLESAFARRESMRRELLNPADERLRGTTVRRTSRDGVTDVAGRGRGARSRGSVSRDNRATGLANRANSNTTNNRRPGQQARTGQAGARERLSSNAARRQNGSGATTSQRGRPSRQGSQSGRVLRLGSDRHIDRRAVEGR